MKIGIDSKQIACKTQVNLLRRVSTDTESNI